MKGVIMISLGLTFITFSYNFLILHNLDISVLDVF